MTPMRSTWCPPVSAPLAVRWFESAGQIAQELANGTGEYWLARAQRGELTPVHALHDTVRWLRYGTVTERPTWHSPNKVVLDGPIARLRDFSNGDADDDVTPTLVLPPQAGHDSCIVDYSPTQSQMRVIRATGLTRAYSLDWIGATAATKDSTVDDYLAFIERAIGQIGGPVNLIGDCQGGWLATIYAALRPQDIHTLTLAGAPIDFHAGGAVINEWVDQLAGPDLAFYRWVVEQGGGVLKGEHMLSGFILMKPENEVAKHIRLLGNLDDERFVERHRAFETWYRHVQDIPGAFYLWIVEHLFMRNALVRGELEIAGERVDLGRITCPVNLLAGAEDHITPPAQVFAAADNVGTRRRQVAERTAPGGHLGLFMGSEALRNHWPALLEDVARRSRPTAHLG